MRRIALRLEAAVALGAAPLHQDADIAVDAEQALGQRQIEVRRLPGAGNLAREHLFVDVDAGHRLLAGAVGGNHHIEQQPYRLGSRRQQPSIDGGLELGAAKHGRLGQLDAKLVEADLFGRQPAQHAVADGGGRKSARRRDGRAADKPPRTHRVLVGDHQHRRATDLDRGESPEARPGARYLDRPGLDVGGHVFVGADDDDAAHPALLIGFGKERQRLVAVMEADAAAGGS